MKPCKVKLISFRVVCKHLTAKRFNFLILSIFYVMKKKSITSSVFFDCLLHWNPNRINANNKNRYFIFILSSLSDYKDKERLQSQPYLFFLFVYSTSSNNHQNNYWSSASGAHGPCPSHCVRSLGIQSNPPVHLHPHNFWESQCCAARQRYCHC